MTKIKKHVTIFKKDNIMLRRFSISLDKDLVDKFDELIKKSKFANRSQAVRHFIKQELVALEWQEDKEVAGALTLVYDHHKQELVGQLLQIQHDFAKSIISTQHVHLDHENCLEIIVVKDNAQKAKKLLDSLKSVKGLKHIALTATAMNI